MKSIITLFLLCFLSIGSMIAQVPSYVPTNGLVGWWPFNGNANDESGNGYNGTVYGAILTTNRLNNSNSAYNFDGINDYIQTSLPYTVFLNKTTLTISAWVNLGTNTSYYGYSVISNLIPSNTQSAFILVGTESSTQHRKLCFAYIAEGGTMTPYVSTGNAIQTNTWTHIAFVLDNGSLRYYIDGALASTHSVPTNGISSEGASQNYRFGQGNPTPGFRQDFNGKIDDIGIWNRALTEAEITALYQASTPLNATAQTISNVNCFYGNNGSATVSSNGGTPPYTYSWNSNPIQTTQTATNLKAGTYTVTVTDSKGSIATANATITQPSAITNVIANTVSNVACFGGNNGSASVTNPSGGTPPFTFSWNTNPIQTTQIATNLKAGMYTVTVTDSKGCTSSSNVTITQPSAISNVTANTLNNVGCFGGNNGSASVTNPTGGTPPYTYQWNTNPIQVTRIAYDLSAGTYMVTVTDSKGCSATSSVTITQPQQLSNVNASTLQHVKCSGASTGSVSVSNPMGGTPPYTYKWNSVPEQTTQTASNLPAGTYSITVTDYNGCMASSYATINEPTKITNVQTSIVKSLKCFGDTDGSAKVSDPMGGTPPYTYRWNTVPEQKTQTVVNLKAGEYSVVVTDANGCTAQSYITITQPNAPLVIGNPKIDKQVSCFGESDGSITIPNPTGGTAPYTVSWNTSPIKKTYSISNLKAGTYTAMITDANGCVASVSATVTEPPKVVVTSPKDSTVLIQTKAFMQSGSNNPASTYQWQTNTGTGFADLQNVFQYSGVKTNTLTVDNCTIGNHNQPFRCVIETKGCYDTTATAILSVRTNVGVHTENTNLGVSIFPNPTGDAHQIMLQFSEAQKQHIDIELLDLLGNQLYQSSLNIGEQFTTIPIHNLCSGMYMIRIHMNNEVYMEKVIVN